MHVAVVIPCPDGAQFLGEALADGDDVHDYNDVELALVVRASRTGTS